MKINYGVNHPIIDLDMCAQVEHDNNTIKFNIQTNCAQTCHFLILKWELNDYNEALSVFGKIMVMYSREIKID